MSSGALARQRPFDVGLAAYQRGDLQKAEAVLTSVIQADASDTEALHVLALVYWGQGRPDKAAEDLEEVVRRQPANAEAWSNYGAVLRELGRLPQARSALEASVSLEPGRAVGWNNLGTVLLDLGLRDEARACLERSSQEDPNYADPWVNSARMLYDEGDLRAAWQSTKTALALDPKCAEAHNRLSFIAAATGNVEEAVASLARAVSLAPAAQHLRSNLALRSLASSRLTAADCRRIAESGWTEQSSCARVRPTRPLQTIGVVSSDLRDHPVGWFAVPVLERLAKTYRLVCYSNAAQETALTERAKDAAHEWRPVRGWQAAQIAEWVMKDGVDVLLDLNGHTADNRLDVFALRPAPVQATWLGYSGTTGLKAIDHLIADPVTVPTGAEEGYTETVARLDGGFLCAVDEFFPSQACEEVDGPVVFGVFNNPAKFSEAAFECWARVLLAVPDSLILFKYLYSGDRWAQRQVGGRLASLGVEEHRIRFQPYATQVEHLGSVGRVSLSLDTFPYSGATTTIDSLRTGTPVVTLSSDRYSGRMTASLLAAVECDDLVAESVDGYVELAVTLANRKDRRRELRERVRAGLAASRLRDADRFTTSFRHTLESMWATATLGNTKAPGNDPGAF